MQQVLDRLLLLLLLTGLAACSGDEHRIDPDICEAVADKVPVCGFTNPEDLALLPDERTLVVSEYGVYYDANPGSLALLDTETGLIERLATLDQPKLPLWADVGCPGPPGASLSPHGIHLSRRSSGELQLLVVNHGGAERIEFVELAMGPQGYRAHWRGCLMAPDNAYVNSVAATPEGGVVFTHMYPRDSFTIGTTAWAVIKSVFGSPSGHIWEWPGSGQEYRVVPGSADGFPNGILVDPSGRYLYMAASTGGRVVKIDRNSGERLGSVDIVHPDNLRWDAEGNILVVGMPVSLPVAIGCQEDARRNINCGGSFEINRINPRTMQAELIFSHTGVPMGAATVAQQVGDYLYIGSFAGNRLLQIPYQNSPGT
ncbi:MAG: hypothetical protein ACK5ME_06310 [Parahaliea sp.]